MSCVCSASYEKLRVCYVLQSYCTVSTNRSTLGSTDRSTEEVPVGTEKVQTLFLARTVYRVATATHIGITLPCAFLRYAPKKVSGLSQYLPVLPQYFGGYFRGYFCRYLLYGTIETHSTREEVFTRSEQLYIHNSPVVL